MRDRGCIAGRRVGEGVVSGSHGGVGVRGLRWVRGFVYHMYGINLWWLLVVLIYGCGVGYDV